MTDQRGRPKPGNSLPDAPGVSAAPARPGDTAPRGALPISTATAYAVLVLVILLWGTNWPIMKVGIGYIPPFWFSFGRLFLAAVTLFAILAVLDRIRLPERRDLPVILSIGLLQMAAFMACTHFALLHVEAGRAAILAYTTPLWVVPAAILFLGERLTRLSALGMAAGLTGVAVLFNPFSFDWGNPDVLLGNGLLLVGAVFWTIGILHIRTHVWRASPLHLAPWQMLVACGPTAALGLVFEDFGAIRWTWEAGAIMLYNGPIATALGFWGLVSINRALPAISTSLAVLGVPALGLFSSVLVTDEVLTASLAGGLLLIVGGVGMVALSDRLRSRS